MRRFDLDVVEVHGVWRVDGCAGYGFLGYPTRAQAEWGRFTLQWEYIYQREERKENNDGAARESKGSASGTHGCVCVPP